MSFYYQIIVDFVLNGQIFAANWTVNKNALQDDKNLLARKGYSDVLAARFRGKNADINAAGVQEQ
ncbi:MAG: hypothetical protein ACTXOO_05975 [Sodalis sp. (in: enterobacteria)]